MEERREVPCSSRVQAAEGRKRKMGTTTLFRVGAKEVGPVIQLMVL